MEHFLVHWGYLALFAVCVLSSLGIPVGSEIVTGYAGALASGKLTSEHDHLSLGVVIGVAVAAELVGSTAGYLVGRFGGRPLVDRLGKYVLLTHRDLDRAEDWFARRGEPFVLFGRCIPLLRSFVSLAAGLGEMAYGKFLAFTVIGSAIFVSVLAGIGYSLGASWHHVLKDFSYAGYVAAALAVLLVVVVFLARLRVVRAERDTDRALHGRRPIGPGRARPVGSFPGGPGRARPVAEPPVAPRPSVVAPGPVVARRPPATPNRPFPLEPRPPVPPRASGTGLDAERFED